MATRRKVNGYEWRAAIADAARATKRAREALKYILDENPSVALRAMCIAKAATALGEVQEALATLREIGRSQ